MRVVHGVFRTKAGQVDTACRADAPGPREYQWNKVTCRLCLTATPKRRKAVVTGGDPFGLAASV